MSADLLLGRDKDQTLEQLCTSPTVSAVVSLHGMKRQKMVDNMNHMIHIVNHIEAAQSTTIALNAPIATRTENRHVQPTARQRHRLSHP
jgi:hypothetical protein